ncbi:uroporphyrinogen-III synthase [Tropicimonas sp. IMCC34011]|uniref:uroporphyrinogen-III synthase n=1 Tax=Tropicimonas sp. IMCC34011 TaxID=2248759 RepID=UPI001E5CF653|nr:uroporphyrinogen-III synthase [Tropicimonas sp. IMCC34011]
MRKGSRMVIAAAPGQDGPQIDRPAPLVNLIQPPLSLSRTTLLLTRPRAASERFAAMLRGWPALGGLPVLIAPLMEIVRLPVPRDVLKDASGIVFTSVNAVEALGLPGAGLPAWCVGPATAQAAEAAGFTVRLVARDAEELVATMTAAPEAGRLVHVGGRHRRGRVAERLTAAGWRCDPVCVYDQVPRPIGTAAQALLGGRDPVLVPVFSPRSAALFPRHASAPLHLAAISAAAAEAWAGPPPAAVRIAPKPDANGVARALGALINTACSP